ncbi:MAG TPA: molybdenum cofactor biosynthesis protein MoaE [Candidatus Competibacteraceae bacterium]|nr:molybdenum cofactor biosynthesis protein MoaE [Candidatus Competibacteraceae bacterium]MCP5133862.1 molybdenum cofactor biosynthesis protein MoaE [Gammaproteobacteria bacterium]HPF58799.1 molybdenum cofactor biosynthesis protein MoaE [Candidatus Competibacteraceae bacterium]
MHIELRDQPFEPLMVLAAYQADLNQRLQGHYGATAIFIGTMRDFNEGDAVQGMMLEHYPGMTERQLHRIIEAACQDWPLLDALLIHRVGALQPNDPIVLVAVWSAHRAAAFAACRFIMEELKSKAPFWKREDTAAGARWVEHNTPA